DAVLKYAQAAIVVADYKVDGAVVVQVADGEAATDLGQPEGGSRHGARLLVAAVAQVVEKLLCLVQWKRILGAHQLLDHVHRAVGDNDVEPAVVVVVDERRAEPRVRCGRQIQPGGGAAVL